MYTNIWPPKFQQSGLKSTDLNCCLVLTFNKLPKKSRPVSFFPLYCYLLCFCTNLKYFRQQRIQTPGRWKFLYYGFFSPLCRKFHDKHWFTYIKTYLVEQAYKCSATTDNIQKTLHSYSKQINAYTFIDNAEHMSY